MNKRDAARLRKERLAQIDRAVSALLRAGESQTSVFRERDRQIRLTQQEYNRNIAASRKSTSKRAQATSRFWRHFGQDGQPTAPWNIEVGPHVPGYDPDADGDFDADDSLFAAEDYGYEDFDVDWGGYDYQDTGYDDENA